MKNLKRIRVAGALTLAPALLAWACGGADNGVSGPTLGISAPANVAGSWVGSWRMESEQPESGPVLAARGGSVRVSLLQFGSAVTGTAEFTNMREASSSADCFEKASVAGRVAANQISLILNYGTDADGRLQGQVEGNTLNGSYGNACVQSATLALRRE